MAIARCRPRRLVPRDLKQVRHWILDAAKPPSTLHHPQKRILNHVGRHLART
jgi:hypothetical protein